MSFSDDHGDGMVVMMAAFWTSERVCSTCKLAKLLSCQNVVLLASQDLRAASACLYTHENSKPAFMCVS